MNNWEKFFDKYIREIAKEKIILDIGSGKPFQKEMEIYKGIFKDCRYYSIDFVSQFGPNIIGDIHHLPIKSKSADAIICKAVLEHIEDPQQAVKELYRVLQKGGKLFAYVPFIYPYHGGEKYKDFYRFTKDGIDYLFRNFTNVKVIPIRGFFGTLNLFIPFTSKNFFLTNFIDKMIKTNSSITSGYNIFAIK